MIKRRIWWLLSCLLLSGAWDVQSQVNARITLDSCLTMAEQNYPQIQQFDLYGQSTEYSLVNAQKGKLPQINIVGQASYQSEVTSLPGGAGMGIPELSKDQYKLYGEIVQPLTGIAVVNQQKKIIHASGSVDEAELETKLYAIKQRVGDLFFGVLLIQGQLQQSALTRADIEAGLVRMNAAVKFGTALKSSADVLKAEFIGLEQRIIEQAATRDGYLKMLGLFIGMELDSGTELIPPVEVSSTSEINRPELKLFNTQINAILLQSELIDKNNLPQFSLFLQSGFGRPALNFLSNDFEPYYIGGLNLSWNLSNFYTSGKQKQILSINEKILLSEKETFLFNTRLNMSTQNTQIGKIQELIAKDEEIIALRDQIVRTSQDQLENGVITTNDYKSAVVDADQARQNMTLHRIELLKLRNDYKLTTGN